MRLECLLNEIPRGVRQHLEVRCMKSPSVFLFAILAIASIVLTIARADEPNGLRETFAPGTTYSVQTEVEISGQLTLPAEKDKKAPEPLKVKGTSKIEYDEKILAPLSDRPGPRTIRNYQTATATRTVGPQNQETKLRAGVYRMIVFRSNSRKVAFSPDAPMTLGELELIRTDVFVPSLGGLLPPASAPGVWNAADEAVEELTGMEKITEGKLECRAVGDVNDAKSRFLQVTFSGKLRGVNEDGPNEQQLKGEYSFDRNLNCLVQLRLNGVHLLHDGKGKETGRIEGKFKLVRQMIEKSSSLGDDALRGVTLEPNADNTMLLYEASVAGARLLYPRRWRVSNEDGKHITLEEPRGNGILITVESSSRVPKTEDYLKETKDYIVGQKGKVQRADPPRRMRSAPHEIDGFGMDIELNQQPARMEYYVVRDSAAGATVAARLLPSDVSVLRSEVDQIVKSLAVGTNAPTGVVPLPNK